jgi:two-component system, LytTR family, sensor kinase
MKDFFTGSKITIFLHLLAWAIVLGLPIYFFRRWEVGNDFIWLYYISNILNGIVFYINYLVLAPKFFFEKKKHRYYISVLIMLIFFYFISSGSNRLIFKYIPGKDHTEEARNPAEEGRKPPEEGRKPGPPVPGRFFGEPPFRAMHLFNYGFTSMFLIFFSLGLRIMERHSQIQKSQKELEKEKLNSELAFLKNQISPHFFFNTLNNIYSLISINAEDSQRAVLKLSKLMRYLLYESDHGNTRLSNELDFMNNYIDLMKLRMSEKVNLNISFPAKYDDINVPPLLFIPFIENAFKHGISYRGKSFIDVSMEAAKNSISFRCANSLAPAKKETGNSDSGIGLENVRKRLILLFPGKHDLKITKSEEVFEVLLFVNFA